MIWLNGSEFTLREKENAEFKLGENHQQLCFELLFS